MILLATILYNYHIPKSFLECCWIFRSFKKTADFSNYRNVDEPSGAVASSQQIEQGSSSSVASVSGTSAVPGCSTIAASSQQAASSTTSVTTTVAPVLKRPQPSQDDADAKPLLPNVEYQVPTSSQRDQEDDILVVSDDDDLPDDGNSNFYRFRRLQRGTQSVDQQRSDTTQCGRGQRRSRRRIRRYRRRGTKIKGTTQLFRRRRLFSYRGGPTSSARPCRRLTCPALVLPSPIRPPRLNQYLLQIHQARKSDKVRRRNFPYPLVRHWPPKVAPPYPMSRFPNSKIPRWKMWATAYGSLRYAQSGQLVSWRRQRPLLRPDAHRLDQSGTSAVRATVVRPGAGHFDGSIDPPDEGLFRAHARRRLFTARKAASGIPRSRPQAQNVALPSGTLKGPLPRNRSHGKKCICRKSSQLLDRRLAVSRLRPPGPAVQFLLNLLERLSFGFNNDSHDEYGADERRPREYEIVQVHAPSESDRVVNLVHDERRRRQDERRHSGCEAFDALREIFALNCRSYGSEPQAEENAVNDKTGEWDPVAIRDVDCRLGVEVEPEACAGHCQGATWSNKNRILKMSSCISTKAQPETEG
ncbi:unnamed protein product [Nesidiocoris tenuis]|uniref:Uncharacterized protein n=1 Tax=Nesidiocoris tenuis TaxID=355587 RepID=A0A6H5GTH5_9HEMI|nr:unnamed protein product [Nesidiocoris tenuis]